MILSTLFFEDLQRLKLKNKNLPIKFKAIYLNLSKKKNLTSIPLQNLNNLIKFFLN